MDFSQHLQKFHPKKVKLTTTYLKHVVWTAILTSHASVLTRPFIVPSIPPQNAHAT